MSHKAGLMDSLDLELGYAPGSGKILFVDDDQELLTVVSRLLAEWGYEVHCASSVDDALELVRRHSPDLVVSDIMMPEKDGILLLDELQQSPKYSSIPFIFLTARTEREQILDAKKRGCADFFSKPFEPEEFQASIEGTLRARKLRDDTGTQKKMLQTLSHEFRTPLVAINTGADLLLSGGESMKPELREKVVNSIRRGGQRLSRLVEDFVTIQRLETGVVAKSQANLLANEGAQGIAVEAIESFHAHLDELGTAREVNFTSYAKDGVIHVCRPQIVSCLLRLLDNAHKFSKPDCAIELTLTKKGNRVVFAVEDYGIGLPPQSWEEACKAFIQVNREFYEQQGVGLGLAIVLEFTRLNHGELALCPEPRERGSRLLLSFPAA